MKRLPSHPLSRNLGELTKNRLKRKSINHITKALQRENLETLPQNQENIELLQDYEEWDGDDLKIQLEVPDVTTKENHSKEELKCLTLEFLELAEIPQGNMDPCLYRRLGRPSGEKWRSRSTHTVPRRRAPHKIYLNRKKMHKLQGRSLRTPGSNNLSEPSTDRKTLHVNSFSD